jgi:hypothetical protein
MNLVILNNLIPKHKFDIEKVELLEGLTFDEIEPIIRNLLEWLQDGNWSVSRPLGIFWDKYIFMGINKKF